jgi:hypothetical protein
MKRLASLLVGLALHSEQETLKLECSKNHGRGEDHAPEAV